MKIRKANIEDAIGIGKVHVDSWRTTYKGILPDDFLNNLSYEQRTELWKKNISDATNYVLVAENEQNEIIGFATGGTRKTNSIPNATDLTSIYLLEEYQGKGIGKQLLKEMFAYFKQKGYEKVFVEVLAENKTRDFYEYYGAQYVNNIEIKIGGKIVEELIYVWNDVNKVTEKIK
ncbi:N-acetyltransferase family protein [Lysinibacillus sp. NPDC093190]|uniref:GNAT family N-acetyltransferase n=1 Tax=Lysinibacillus sp. NPDC093190 TaxID=3390575 RepID=UPI003D0520C2